MLEQTKMSGVILAGGLARRMGGLEKGLVFYKQRPLLAYAIAAMQPVTGNLLLNVNRDLERYRAFGLPLLTDGNSRFEGPLAGILAALRYVQDSKILLVMPCDSPSFRTEHLQKLLLTLQTSGAECCAAFDGERLHPVFLAVQTSVKESLESYLASGERRIETWLQRLHSVRADFSATPEIFKNINSSEDLAALEAI